jgi:hypothetical protein
MIDINIFVKQWEAIVNWFVIQPIYIQILIVVGAIAIVALAITLVYYVLKGAAYLVYYMLKGAYSLFKGIGIFFYGAFEALYYEITGKPTLGTKPAPQSEVSQANKNPEPIALVQTN